MQRLLTAQQAKEMDKRLKDKYGISTLILMENAGKAVADSAIKLLKKGKDKSVVVFCGMGNNGGDGLVAARHLLVKGINVDIYLVGCKQDLKDEARINYEILKRLGHRIRQLKTIKYLKKTKKKLKRYGLIIDALLGVGLKGTVAGLMKEAIGIMNASGVPILAVDVPSGLNATTGKVLGSAVKAVCTVTFMAVKKGLLTKEGSFYSGKVEVCDLGIPIF